MSMRTAINLPAGTDIRTALRGGKAVVMVGPKDEPRLPPGSVNILLTHDAGTSWPDRAGVLLADVALENGGSAFFEFCSLADALAFRQRLGGAS